MSKPFISIIVNFYKSEKYVHSLLRSVYNQSFTDWEVICVVDGSPGRDVERIRSFVKRYGNADKVTIHDNPVNIGISKAKKLGIDLARGEYITFIDGDDMLAPLALEKMAEAARSYDVDFVNANYCRYFPVTSKTIDTRVNPNIIPHNRRLEHDEFFEAYFMNFFTASYVHYGYWAKLYRATMLKTLDFDYPDKEHMFSEDKWFNMALAPHIQSACFIDYVAYLWRWGGVSNFRSHKYWSLKRMVLCEIEHYPECKAMVDKYHYTRSLSANKRVIITAFISYIGTVAKHKPGSPKALQVMKSFDEMYSHPLFPDLSELLAEEQSPSDRAFTEAVLARDYDTMYRMGHDLYQSGRNWRRVQNVVNFFLRPLRHVDFVAFKYGVLKV